jgi:hypothetical protein
MKTEANISGITAMAIHNWFRRISKDEVFLRSPCIKTELPYHLRIGDVYEVHILKSENGSVKIGYVKLLWVYLKGMTFHIIAVDIQSGELIHMSQRLGSDNPCDFIIADVLYYDIEDLSTKILKGLTDNDIKLLEFDFDNT